MPYLHDCVTSCPSLIPHDGGYLINEGGGVSLEEVGSLKCLTRSCAATGQRVVALFR
jgi:hypothetical protein